MAGWEPREVTTYHYDGAGRLTHSVTAREPEWDDTEAALAAALHDDEAETCSGCGQPKSESMDPANSGEPGSTGRYEVAATFRCHACTALSIKADQVADKYHPGALRFGLRLTRARG